MITLNFGDYKTDVDFIDYKLTIKKILSDMDKSDLIEFIWEHIDWLDFVDIFDDELRNAYPPPDDEDPDDELRRYYDRVRM